VDLIGQQFGSYVAVKKLGAGGMGTVYLCEHTMIDRKVRRAIRDHTRCETANGALTGNICCLADGHFRLMSVERNCPAMGFPNLSLFGQRQQIPPDGFTRNGKSLLYLGYGNRAIQIY
jgi:hypothetical protein